MAQMGYGYGSEFHLLRFLGHHRNLLEKSLREAIGSINGDFYWFDFDFDERKWTISGDKEKCGLSFLKEKIPKISKVCDEIKNSFSWNFDTWQHWDAVFMLDGVLYFVEAKAHVKELRSKKKNGGTHPEDILNFMRSQFENATKDWLGVYYQFANRLSTVSFLNNKGIKCKLVNIYFVNGYYDRKHHTIKDTSEDSFREEINKELETLGLDVEEKKKYSFDAFIDANP